MLNKFNKQHLTSSWCVCQVLQRSFLRNPSSNLWRELFVLVELCALKLKACGFTWTSSKTLFTIAVRSSRVLWTTRGPVFQHTRGMFHYLWTFNLSLYFGDYITLTWMCIIWRLFTAVGLSGLCSVQLKGLTLTSRTLWTQLMTAPANQMDP